MFFKNTSGQEKNPLRAGLWPAGRGLATPDHDDQHHMKIYHRIKCICAIFTTNGEDTKGYVEIVN